MHPRATIARSAPHVWQTPRGRLVENECLAGKGGHTSHKRPWVNWSNPFFPHLSDGAFFSTALHPHPFHPTTYLAMTVVPLPFFRSCSFSPRGDATHAAHNVQKSRSPISHFVDLFEYMCINLLIYYSNIWCSRCLVVQKIATH